MKPELASDKVINTIARFMRTELDKLHARLDEIEASTSKRLDGIDQNLSDHMRRTAILESARAEDVAVLRKNAEILNQITPVLERYRAAETAAKWLYKPVLFVLVAFVSALAGANTSTVIELIKAAFGG